MSSLPRKRNTRAGKTAAFPLDSENTNIHTSNANNVDDNNSSANQEDATQNDTPREPVTKFQKRRVNVAISADGTENDVKQDEKDVFEQDESIGQEKEKKK